MEKRGPVKTAPKNMFSLIAKILAKIRNLFKNPSDDFLCDTCAYDYPSACNNSKRPNAKECADYKRRL
ncbi:MAG: hypothetical protein A2231_10780 [Candidatus Firestonebacteria bacterium RIFOXYA2_FULL_40_8]|nr:MAG: hypothetical protein A2231_10780 [Candidatus Firestonebacteria bacterium RIFOXYA2_FULL_40_8]